MVTISAIALHSFLIRCLQLVLYLFCGAALLQGLNGLLLTLDGGILLLQRGGLGLNCPRLFLNSGLLVLQFLGLLVIVSSCCASVCA